MVKRMRRGIPRAAAVALGISVGAAQGSAAQEAERLYVAVQGEAQVAVVDMEALEEVARVDLTQLGFTANAKPHHIAVEPGGDHWYVSLIGENRVLKFDRENRLVDQAEFEVPGMLATHPTEDWLFVGRSMSAVNPPERIGALRRSDMSVEEADVFFPRPHALIVSRDGERIYSASLAVNQLGAVDVETLDMALTQVPGPVHTLVQFAASPDGSTLVATAQLTGLLLVFDLADPDSPRLRGEIPVGRQPWHPVYHPTDNVVYTGTKMDHSVVAVDTDTGEILWRTTHPGLDHPHGSAISLDGERLFVSSNGPGGMQGMQMGGEPAPPADSAAADASAHAAHGQEHHGAHAPAGTGTVTVLDARTGSVLKVLPMGENTTGLGARPR